MKFNVENSMKWLNIILLQFLFVRIDLCEQRLIQKIDPLSFGLDGSFSAKVKESKIKYWYSIHFFVLPFSGWFGQTYFIGKRRSVRISFFYYR